MQITNWQLIFIESIPLIGVLLYLSPVFLAAILTPFIATYNMFKNTMLYLKRKPMVVQRSNGDYIYHPILNFWMRVTNIALYITGPIFAWNFMKFATNDFTKTIFTAKVEQAMASRYAMVLLGLLVVVLVTTYWGFLVTKPTRNYPYIKDETV